MPSLQPPILFEFHYVDVCTLVYNFKYFATYFFHNILGNFAKVAYRLGFKAMNDS
jgi:hypothetical protein